MKIWNDKRRFAVLLLVVVTIVTVLCIVITTNMKKKVNSVTTTAPSSLNMKIGENYTIETKVLPLNASNKNLIFTSSNQKVVKVTSKGTLTALETGTATITVKAANGFGAKASCRLKVIVSKPSQVIHFTSKDNYHSYMYVNIDLPEGVSAADITSFGFQVGTKNPLSLRLYAGSGSVIKSDKNELTYEEKKFEYTVTNTENVTENSTTVKKTKHNLNDNIKKSTRIAVEAGDNQSVTFDVDDNAKKVLSSISGKVLTLGIYAHNIAPTYSINSFQFKTASKTYDVELNVLNVGGVDNGMTSISK